jgi:hypothetical protein
LLRRSAHRNDRHILYHCERSEAISVLDDREDIVNGWQWPMIREPPMVLPPKKVPPIEPELPAPLEATMPIPTDLLPAPLVEPIGPPI